MKFLRVLFELVLIAAVILLAMQVQKLQGTSEPVQTGNKSGSTSNEQQTLQQLQSLAVEMGATDTLAASSKNAMDLISDIQIKLGSAQTCSTSTLNKSEIDTLSVLLGVKDQETLAKIKSQDAFISKMSGSKILVLKKE